MKIKQLLNEDDAVSPVIGVILMVAITMILAAVIATFVLGLGEQISETSPNASFTFDYNESVSSGSGDFGGSYSSSAGSLTITHAGGPNIEPAQLDVVGSSVSNAGGNFADDASVSSEVTAGTSVDVAVSAGDTVSITWQNDEGTESATLQRYEVPN